MAPEHRPDEPPGASSEVGFTRVGVLPAIALLALILAAIAAALAGWPPKHLWRPQHFGARLLCAAVLSGIIGFAELVSRYRDQTWRVAATGAGPLSSP